MPDKFPGGYFRGIEIERSCRVVLHPLTEVVIRVLMAIRIGGGQFMMDLLCNGKWGKSQQQEN